MNELIAKIEKWAHERNIINGSKPIDQAMKLFSEFGELADNVGKGRDCRDDIGDVFVVLTIMSAQLGIKTNALNQSSDIYDLKSAVASLGVELSYFAINQSEVWLNDAVRNLNSISELSGHTLEECVQIAYDDIKDRKGIMSGGIFIKESDPVYAQVILEIEENSQCQKCSLSVGILYQLIFDLIGAKK